MNEIELRFLDEPHVCSKPKRQNPFDITMHPVKKLLLRILVVSKKHPEHWRYLECENDILFERRRQILSKSWFVMHPFSILAGVCDTIILIVFCLDQYYVPFVLPEDYYFSVRFFTTMMINLNVIRQFFTGYIDKEFMVAVLDMKKIASHYFRGCFLLDLIGALPFHYTTMSILASLGTMDIQKKELMGFLRWNRLLTLRLFRKSLLLTMEFFNANPVVKRVLPMVLYSFVFLNWSACMLYFVPRCVHGADLRNVNDSWLNIKTGPKRIKPLEENPLKLYALCIFRSAMLLLKLGFGADYPKTSEDVYLSVLYVIAGRLILFVIIEQVLSVAKWVRSPRVRYLAQMGLVKGFLRHRDVPPTTRKKVQMYFERQLGGTYFREGALLSLLSGSLREELRDHELRLVIRDSVLLRRLPPGLAVRVARCLKREIFLPNDVVMRIGSFGDCMYFVVSGTVCIVTRNGFELRHVEDGEFVGEVEILTATDRRVWSVIAVEVCELYRLDRNDALRYLRMAPEIWLILKNRAEDVLNNHHNETLIHSLKKQFDSFK